MVFNLVNLHHIVEKKLIINLLGGQSKERIDKLLQLEKQDKKQKHQIDVLQESAKSNLIKLESLEKQLQDLRKDKGFTYEIYIYLTIKIISLK